MFSISIKTIPHNNQRYNTVGDYYEDANGIKMVLISDLGDWKMETLIMVHELVELALCKAAGVTDAQIDEFDFAFAANRDPDDSSEPGNNRKAPYYTQHKFACKVERMLARALRVNWKEYERRQAACMSSYKQNVTAD